MSFFWLHISLLHVIISMFSWYIYLLRGMYKLARKVNSVKIFLSPLSLGSTLKGKHLLHQKQILPFQRRHLLCRGLVDSKAKRKLQELSPFEKIAENLLSIHIPLEIIILLKCTNIFFILNPNNRNLWYEISVV